jgi:hypothetical protein
MAGGAPGEVLRAETLSAAYGTAMDVLRTEDGRIIALPAVAGRRSAGGAP